MPEATQHGVPYLRQVCAADLLINRDIINGTITPAADRRQAAAWGGRCRQQDCIDVAFRLGCVARQGELSAASLPVPRREPSGAAGPDASAPAAHDGSALVTVGGAR